MSKLMNRGDRLVAYNSNTPVVTGTTDLPPEF